MAKPNRLRFSLRTMFVMVAIVGVALGWLVWQARIVKHRLSLLKQFQETNVNYWITGDVTWMHHSNVKRLRIADESVGPSWIRKLMGDCNVSAIGIDRQLTTADRQAIKAFPEAEINAWPNRG